MGQGFQSMKKGVPPQMSNLVSNEQTNSKGERLLCLLLYDKRAYLV